MKYLPACDVTGFWQKIVGDNFLLHEVPVSVDVIFWPTRSYLENGESHWVQPDLRFDFKWSNGSTRIILVEIKWNSGLDEGQLRRQWGSYLSPGERKIARHVFIAKNTDIGDEGHRGGVIVKSWRDVQDVLNGFRERDGAVARWAMLVSGFLGKVTARPFNGFGALVATGEGRLRFYAPSDFFTEERLSHVADLNGGAMSFYKPLIGDCGDEWF
ncbi:hypothetical protein [Rhodanobacter lindaniclasticus]